MSGKEVLEYEKSRGKGGNLREKGDKRGNSPCEPACLLLLQMTHWVNKIQGTLDGLVRVITRLVSIYCLDHM